MRMTNRYPIRRSDVSLPALIAGVLIWGGAACGQKNPPIAATQIEADFKARDSAATAVCSAGAPSGGELAALETVLLDQKKKYSKPFRVSRQEATPEIRKAAESIKRGIDSSLDLVSKLKNGTPGSDAYTAAHLALCGQLEKTSSLDKAAPKSDPAPNAGREKGGDKETGDKRLTTLADVNERLERYLDRRISACSSNGSEIQVLKSEELKDAIETIAVSRAVLNGSQAVLENGKTVDAKMFDAALVQAFEAEALLLSSLGIAINAKDATDDSKKAAMDALCKNDGVKLL